LVGKIWYCSVHGDKKCWFPYIDEDIIGDRLFRGFSCEYTCLQIPGGSENGFFAIWSTLYDDTSYLQDLNSIFKKAGF
jgi:hypothetical protein